MTLDTPFQLSLVAAVILLVLTAALRGARRPSQAVELAAIGTGTLALLLGVATHAAELGKGVAIIAIMLGFGVVAVAVLAAIEEATGIAGRRLRGRAGRAPRGLPSCRHLTRDRQVSPLTCRCNPRRRALLTSK